MFEKVFHKVVGLFIVW